MRPLFRVGALSGPSSRLISCEVVDQDGRESDSVTVEVDDRNGEVGIPALGTVLPVAMGYRETGLSPMGVFIVDEVTMQGWPQRITVRGKSVDLMGTWKQGRTQDYHNKTVSQIVQEVAGRNGVGASVLGPVASHMYTYLSQSEESDLHFLTRLAATHDAMAKHAGGLLVFANKGMLLGGAAQAIYPENVKSYSASIKGRPEHGNSQGSNWNLENGERNEQSGSSGGGGGAKFQLPPMWADGQQEAMAAAQGRGAKLGRATRTLSITMIGDPSVMAEGALTVSGVRAGVDGLWRVKTATHSIDTSGYETRVDAEAPG